MAVEIQMRIMYTFGADGWMDGIIIFIPRQARLTGEGIVFSVCPYFRSFVCLLPNLSTRYFQNIILAQIGTNGSGGKKVKDQGHTSPKIDLEAWRVDRRWVV